MQYSSGQTVSRAYKLKAGFLYNFTQFVEWPDAAFKEPASPFIVGVLGPDPFGSYLDSILAGEKISGHAMIVQRYQSVAEVQSSHILFISLPHPDTTELTGFKNQPVLTVSDADNFMKLGGIIRFFTQDNKIRLQINPSAAKASKLTISSKLLKLAEIYNN